MEVILACGVVRPTANASIINTYITLKSMIKVVLRTRTLASLIAPYTNTYIVHLEVSVREYNSIAEILRPISTFAL